MANIAANIASPQFGAVVLATLGIGFQVLVHGFRFPGIGRGSVFGKGFHDKANPAYTNLLEEHKKATGEDKLPTNGYPDMGTGRYAQLLPYKQWLEFANAQRIHYNYVEGAASAILFSLASGVYYPKYAPYAAALYIVGREVFAWGYSKGPNQRIYGAVLLDVALLAMLGLATVGAVRHARLI